MIARIANLLKQVNFKQFRINTNRCFLCKCPIQLKLYDNEMGVRCAKCGASAVSQSLGWVFNKQAQSDQSLSVYELSSRGPFVRFLQRTHHQITLSEFMDEVTRGQYKDGVICQDVQNLTYENHTFDICTSSEVFEHVENDLQGFSEMYRVLKIGGQLMFTVPINLNQLTTERTRIVNGKRKAILPPEYHTDKLRGTGQVFCYRNYGFDILQRLEKVGFKHCQIIIPETDALFGFGRPVIIAEK